MIGDGGTANVHFAAAPHFLLRSHTGSLPVFETFQHGRSVSYQRLEVFWSQLQRLCIGY